MWLWKTQNGEIRELSDLSGEKRCPICGQYFKKGEKGCVVIPPMGVRKMHKKLNQNMMVHLSEWNVFVENIFDDTTLAQKIIAHKKPHVTAFTEVEEKRIEAFNRACIQYGFLCEYKKPYGVKRQMRGSSVAVEYNVFSDKIDISHRGKRGLFDSIYERQIIANIYNKMHEILADGKHDDYSAAKTIAGITDEVNKSMKEMGF